MNQWLKSTTSLVPMWDKGIQAKGKARQSSQKCQSQRQEFLSSCTQYSQKQKTKNSFQYTVWLSISLLFKFDILLFCFVKLETECLNIVLKKRI